jgi:GntR family transcriptional regulator/MocR family aminotransferase
MDYVFLIARYSKNQNKTWSAQKTLHAALKNAIQDGALAAGTRLLSSRVLAQELGIARNTVVYAYEQLVCEGYLSTDRRGSVVNNMAVVARQLQVVTSHVEPSLSLARRA